MKTRRFWGSISQKTTVLFLAAAVVSVLALIWMGLRLIRQDRILELQQLDERRETAADRIITTLDQTLANEEQKLTESQIADTSLKENDYFLVSANSEEIRVYPEDTLLYYPVMPAGNDASARPFVNADRAEFQDNNFTRAISILRSLSRSGDPSIKAAAKFRLARNLRKAGRLDAALEIYEEIKDSGAKSNAMISGIPVDLVARRASCALLEEIGDQLRLKEEAENLLEDLTSRRWRLDRASYLYYSDQAEEWLNQESNTNQGPRALAEAVVWLWENRPVAGSIEQNFKDRRSLNYFGRSITVLWQNSNDGWAAVITGPTYQHSKWFEPLFNSPDFSPYNINLCDSEGLLVYGMEIPADVPVSSRTALVTGLPGT